MAYTCTFKEAYPSQFEVGDVIEYDDINTPSVRRQSTIVSLKQTCDGKPTVGIKDRDTSAYILNPKPDRLITFINKNKPNTLMSNIIEFAKSLKLSKKSKLLAKHGVESTPRVPTADGLALLNTMLWKEYRDKVFALVEKKEKAEKKGCKKA